MCKGVVTPHGLLVVENLFHACCGDEADRLDISVKELPFETCSWRVFSADTGEVRWFNTNILDFKGGTEPPYYPYDDPRYEGEEGPLAEVTAEIMLQVLKDNGLVQYLNSPANLKEFINLFNSSAEYEDITARIKFISFGRNV